jgi:hypothetical protein
MIALWLLNLVVGCLSTYWYTQHARKVEYGWATFYLICAGLNLGSALGGVPNVMIGVYFVVFVVAMYGLARYINNRF